MATRIIVLFNLKPGITHEEYLKFAMERDIPTVNTLASIDKFEVFRATGLLGTDAAPPYQYIEVVDVDDMDQFGKDISTETMQAIAAEFTRIADTSFILTEKLG